MKITNISTAVIEGNFDWVLVRVDTDTGISGLGEAYWGVGVAELVHKAKPLLIGANPFDIGKHVEVMVRCLSGEGSQAGATVTAISGIEIALWDLVGRALNTPIYNLFGGRFRQPDPDLRRLPRRTRGDAGIVGRAGAGGRSNTDSPQSSSIWMLAIRRRLIYRTIPIRAATGTNRSTARLAMPNWSGWSP